MAGSKKDKTDDRHRLPRWLKVVFTIAMVCVLLFVGWHWSLSYAIDREIAAIRERGEPVTFDDVLAMYPPIEGENLATELLEAVEAMMRPSEFDRRYEAGELVLKMPPNVPTGEYDLSGESWVEFEKDESDSNSHYDYVETPSDLLPYLGMMEYDKGERLCEYALPITGKFLELNEEAIRIAMAARTIERGRYPIDGLNSKSNLDHYSKLRALANLLAAKARHDMDTGHTDRAIETIDAITAIARSLEDEPLLISQLLRIGINGLALGTIQHAMLHSPLTDAQCAELDRIVARLRFDPHARRAFQVERVCGLALFDDPESLITGGGVIGAYEITDAQMLAHRALGTIKLDRLTYLSVMQEQIDITKLPMPDRLAEYDRVRGELDTLRDGRVNRFVNACSANLLFSFHGTDWIKFRVIASARVTRIGLAVERYRLAHGKLPEKLDDLAPAYFDKLPVDPFTNQPMLYKLRDEGGYVVWSVGRNLVDDGGLIQNEFDGRWHMARQDAGFYQLR